MNKKSLTFILYLIFISQFFVDAANGFFQEILNYHSVFPSIYKTILFLFLLCFIQINNIAGKFFIYLCILYSIPFSLWLINGELLSLKQEIAVLIKILYPYLMLNFILRYQSFISAEKFLKILCSYGLLSGITILICNILDIQGSNPTIYAYGTKGIFRAGNDIGLVMFFTFLLVIYLISTEKKLFWFICAGLLVFNLFHLGTMTGLLVTFFAGVMSLFMLIFYRFKDLHIPLNYRLILLVSTAAFAFISIHLATFVIDDNDYMRNKFDSFISGRSRGDLPLLTTNIFHQSTIVQKLFGHSNYKFKKELYFSACPTDDIHLSEDTDERTPEVDFHEMILSYGVIYGTLLSVFPVMLTLKSILAFLRNRTFLKFIILMISIALLLHSALAGHVLFVFTVCGLWFPLYAFLDHKASFAEDRLKQCKSCS